MIENKIIIGVALVAIVLVAGMFFGRNFISNIGDDGSDFLDVGSEISLGNLCSGEEECISFCLSNIGQCQSYCLGNGNELCSVIFHPEDDEQSTGGQSNEVNCVSNPNPVFTHAFTDIAKLTEVSQYGNNALYNPGSQARSYVSVKEGESTPVYAPINMTITRIYYSDKNYSFLEPGFIRPEYRINFEISCEVEMAYDHIVSLADKFKEFAPQVSSPGRNEGVEVSILVKAGEIIGYTSGSFPGRAFDFIMLNKAKLHPHLNRARWVTDNSLYKDCPYDYFTDELKQQYYNLFVEEQGVRSCGPRVKEVQNTVAGYWFQGEATESNGPRFVIYGSKHFVEWTLIKSSESPVAYRTQDAGFVLPEKITQGKSTCYYDGNRNVYLYVKMISNDKMGLVTGNGNCPSGFPAQHETWVR
mgnify:CR=1 FL=1